MTRRIEPGPEAYTAAIRAVLDRATPEDVSAGRDWYPAAARAVAVIAAHTGADQRAVAVAVAALSPRNPWRWNVQDAAALAEWHRFGRKGLPPTCTTFGTNVRRALEALETGETAWSRAPKVRSFVANILGDPDAVTVDVWAIRAATDGAQSTVRPGQYAAVADAYRAVAAEVGETPRDLQAIVWVTVLRESGRTTRTGACKRGTFDWVAEVLV